MIIESAATSAIYQLMLRDNVSALREEEVSHCIASACNSVLSAIDSKYSNFVHVENHYPNSRERCDILIESKKLTFPYPELCSHNTYVECKFFRQDGSGTNSAHRAESLWEDFKKVIQLGWAQSYSVVLCENDLNTVLPMSGKHSDAVKACFFPESASKFSLWVNSNLFSGNDMTVSSFADSSMNVEIQIVRNFTEPFPLKFDNHQIRLFRIYVFHLFSKEHNCPAFEF